MKYYNVVCTFFGVGKIRKAPGTFGSLATFPFVIFVNYIMSKFQISHNVSQLIWLAIIIGIFFFGIKCCDLYAKDKEEHDSSEIVIDEVVGQLITIFVSSYFITNYANHILSIVFYPFLCFILFRFFDIYKPWVIGKLDKNLKGGYGVMMDDVVAGFFAGLSINFMILIKLL